MTTIKFFALQAKRKDKDDGLEQFNAFAYTLTTWMLHNSLET